ncbi:TPA: hypothetical protein WI034_001490 [Neisseria meningitidis]
MKLSERLRKKLKQNFPQIDYIDNLTFYRGYGVPDGVKFSWYAIDHTQRGKPMLYSYDTMTDCLKEPIAAVYTDGIGHTPKGWMVGIENLFLRIL